MTIRSRTYLAITLVALFVYPAASWGLTVETQSDEASLRGEPVTLRLKVASRGVEEGPSFPLGSTQGSVGEEIDLGKLDESDTSQVQLLVELPWGSYFEDVPPEDLKTGRTTIKISSKAKDGRVTVAGHRILLQPFPGRLMVREILLVSNPTNGLIGTGEDGLELDLPANINRVIPGPSMADGNDLKPVGDTYRYQRAFPPGRTVLGFFYMVQSPGDTFDFSRRFMHPTEKFMVSVPEMDQLEVQSGSLLQRREADQGRNGRSSQRFVGSGLKPGDTVSLRLAGLSAVSPGGMAGPGGNRSAERTSPSDPLDRPSSFSNVSWPLILGIGLSVLIFVGAYGYVQYRLSDLETSGPDEDFLVREIANLDQEFDDGAIDEPYYKRTRRRWKDRLEELDDGESA